ncbi:MAG: type II toxin-antitoxin system VapC family toxin [Nitrococcus sp.]|nr:type II toxin-antitoxin system VapC family toxin [Nitrococcus sp.]
MRLTLDASMALAWLLERELAQEVARADQALLAVADAETLVPPLWHTEVANALLVGERRRIITEAQVIDYLDRLYGLSITTDDAAPVTRRDLIMALAREYGLTAYDATYLDLALRTGSVLATFDGKLADAMRRAGGEVFGDV